MSENWVCPNGGKLLKECRCSCEEIIGKSKPYEPLRVKGASTE